jgi:transcriptional regulator with XRE-family HTH domain
MDYNRWLMDKFVEWERKKGQRQSYSAFARYLGVKQSSLSQWLAGNYPPSRENVEKLAEKLGPEIYDIMGMERPDPDIEQLVRLYSAATPEQKKEILRQALRLAGFDPES